MERKPSASPDAGGESGSSAPPVPRPTARAQFRWLAVEMAATDYLVIFASFIVSYVIRFGTSPDEFDFLGVMVLAPPLWIALFAAFRLYSSVFRMSAAEEFRRVIYAATIGITGIVTVSYWTKAELSRAWVGMSWVLALVALLVVRRLWRYAVWRNRTKGLLTFRTLILGTNEEAIHLADVMRARADGFEPVGFVATGAGNPPGVSLPIVAHLRDIDEAMRATGADCVYVASTAVSPADMRIVTALARNRSVEVRVSANIPEMFSSRLAAQPMGGLMAFSLWPVRLTGGQAVAKRGFDLVATIVLGLVAVPLGLLAALVVRLGSSGPVLYRQTRIGKDGTPFTLLKFRTMVVGADAMVRDLRDRNEASSPLFKIRDDARLTRGGRFLRRWSLDELPQFLNVLRGDMSLVGPRPSLPGEVAAYEPWHLERLEVRPGITGLWQVSGRAKLTFDDYVRLDLFYIENWSLAYDVYLVAKTIPAVVRGHGAY